MVSIIWPVVVFGGHNVRIIDVILYLRVADEYVKLF